jgi:hypothetical protein
VTVRPQITWHTTNDRLETRQFQPQQVERPVLGCLAYSGKRCKTALSGRVEKMPTNHSEELAEQEAPMHDGGGGKNFLQSIFNIVHVWSDGTSAQHLCSSPLLESSNNASMITAFTVHSDLKPQASTGGVNNQIISLNYL